MPVNGFSNSKNKVPVYSAEEAAPEFTKLDNHVDDATIHVTAEDKATWDDKVGLNPNTGKIDEGVLPSSVVLSSKIGAANGVAPLGANARVPFANMPIGSAWTTTTIPASSITAAGYTFPISFQRATVIFNQGGAAFYGQYDKQTQTFYGVRRERRNSGTIVSMGNLSTDYFMYNDDANESMRVAATASGLKFTLLREVTPAEIEIIVRQDA